MSVLLLILAIIGFMLMNLMSKLGGQRGAGSMGLVLMLYAMGGVLSLGISFTQPAAWRWDVVGLGAIAGVTGALGYLAFVHAIRIGHYGLSSAIMSASFVGAVIVSVAFLGETVTTRQVIGIAMLMAAIGLIAQSSKPAQGTGGGHWARWVLVAGAAFTLNLFPMITQKFSSNIPDSAWPFLTVNFFVGCLLLLPMAVRSMSAPRVTFAFGIAAGAFSVVGNLSSLLGIPGMGASLFFPVMLSGLMMSNVLLSVAMFKEKINKLGAIGIACELTGIAMIFFLK